MGLTVFSQLRVNWQIGLKLSTFGINISLPRCLCSFGAFFTTDFLPRIIWCGGVFFFTQMRCACPVVGVVKQQHIFFLDCNVFGSLWYHVWLWLGISSVPSSDLHQHFIQFINMAGLPRSTHMFFKIIWFTSVWVIWKEKNDRVFNNKASIPSILIEKVKLTSFLWLKSKQATFIYSYHVWWNQPLLCMGVHL